MDNRLTKELIRVWLLQRQTHPEPPPEPEQIRRKVGWSSHGTTPHSAAETQRAAEKALA